MNITPLTGYKDSLLSIINGILVPALMAVAFIVFLWGVYKYYFWKVDADAERAKGKTLILYGIVGFVIITCIWGIIAVFSQTLNLGIWGTNTPQPPTFTPS